jgi:uncharacterized protein (DUF305 family)
LGTFSPFPSAVFHETFFAIVRIQWQAFMRIQMKILDWAPVLGLCRFWCERKLHIARIFATLHEKSNFARVCAAFCGIVLAAFMSAASHCGAMPTNVHRQQNDAVKQGDAGKAVVVQPGAPGQPSKILPPSTRGMLPPKSQADVNFMQGMIMHHAQAVEMTALIASHTENKELASLGARISSSQTGEIKFMRQWLAMRGESLTMAKPAAAEAGMDGMAGMDMSHEGMALMPGMLTPEQMEALRRAKGAKFDKLFLTGMIQHHNGALTMVQDLFDTAGAGQDADLFNFATDADNTQRAEIRIMEGMLEKNSSVEKKSSNE